MKYIQLLFLLWIFGQQDLLAQPPGRQTVLLDDDWKFSLGHAANPDKDFNYSQATIFTKSGGAMGTAIDPRFADSNWRTVQLPHDWAVELPFVNHPSFDVQSHGYKPVGGHFPESSIGWYRKHFRVAAADSGRRFHLQFDGIYRNASVWVNGFFVKTNASGYLGFSTDITDVLRYDADNVIAVRVDATQYEGWFYEGAGIYRHVWLHSTNTARINDPELFIRSAVNGSKATVSVSALVQNDDLRSRNLTINALLLNRDGSLLAQTADTKLSIVAGSQASFAQQLTLTNPRLWNLDDPYLYRVVVQLKENGRIIDSKTWKHGFRTIEVKPDGLRLNGKKIKLLGTNNHQDHAGVGSAIPDALQYYRIYLLKNMGVNAYRTSHNAPTPELLEACDSLGMLVMDEQRLLNSGPEYMAQFEQLIKRDRNHTSVFMWSIGNEEGWIQRSSQGKHIAQTLLQKLALLDDTRTATYAADLPNHFTGVNEVIPVRGFNYRQFAVADYHADHPNQPIIGTEMGSTVTTRGEYTLDSVRGYVPDQDITAPWWASTAETWWQLAANNDFWLGGFIWTGFDYRGEPTPFTWPNINSHFGIMDMCGFPKNIYYYYQSWWTDKDVLHISPHWNWMDKRGQPIEVWVNSNADSVALFLNGKALGTKTMPRNSHLKWTVNYEPGELKAVAYKKGRSFSTSQTTTGTPAEVVITPYKTTLLADGRDVSVINVKAIDREGRLVPTANNMIRFQLKGPGRIIGVGNGDPSSHEPDKCADGMWQRSLFNGQCQVIVQSTGQTGMISFDATAAGLWKGSTDISTVAPGSADNSSLGSRYNLSGEAALPRPVPKMLGADISFLPELEARGMRFSDKGEEKDAIAILRDHGFNYVRLRIFNDPARDSGYSPGKGFCDLSHTLQMAKRVKDAGLGLLLDFHYSDYWADPGKQYKPAAWRDASFTILQDSVYQFTRRVMQALQAQNTLPDMVQVGNEINHGIIWPDGNVQHPDSLAMLLKAGTAGVKAVAPQTVMMLHVALGGQNQESVWFIDNMVQRGVHFDVIGQSYYPKWHGTLSDLDANLNDLIRRYNKDVIVVEYSHEKEAVNRIAFGLPDGRGKGTCIWEPLNTWDAIFEKDGKSNAKLGLYDLMRGEYLK